MEIEVIYVENDCKDIWDWSEKVYRIIEQDSVMLKCKLSFLFWSRTKEIYSYK